MAEQPIFGVTNIPQDIKLELNNGTLTLKAGSKVYVPNGVGGADEIAVPTDKTLTSGANWQFMVFYNKTSGNFYRNTDMSHHYSGNTAPENPVNQTIWYDTTNNLVKMYFNGAWTSDWSFPLAVITATGSISSIDKVFNGFGYIGSTLFVLPGVEGFYPNGKDGFNNLFTIRKHNVLSVDTVSGSKENVPIIFTSTGNHWWTSGFEIVDELPNVEDAVLGKRYYNKKDNFVYATGDGVSYVKDGDIPYGYITTTSTSPYRITSFEIVNPFATITPHIVSDYSKYLANLLIIQYNGKPRAKETIESIGAMFPDELILSVRDGFSIDTATGKQLDILAKYIGASRGYTDSNNQKAILTDEEFRVLLKLKIIVNNGTGTLYGLETNLYNLFGTGIRVVETQDVNGNPNMGLTYYIRSDWANIGLAAVQQNILPHPTGVGYTYNLAALTKYFGFIEYTNLSHPFTTGFRDYNDPTKAGEMYAYDKVIQQ